MKTIGSITIGNVHKEVEGTLYELMLVFEDGRSHPVDTSIVFSSDMNFVFRWVEVEQ